MSQPLNIAAVTATLATLLQPLIPGYPITTGVPSASAGATPRINLCLYLVSPNTALNTNTLPARSPTGTVTQPPTLALDLHYAIAFFGEQNLEAQRLFEAVATLFNANPILSPTQIQAAIASTGPFGYLSASTLPAQSELIRIAPFYPALPDLAQLNQILGPFPLNLYYTISPILLTS